MIDIDRIEGRRRVNNGWIGRCPVCALENRDTKCSHLSVLDSGVFNCVVDSNHNKDIYKILSNGEEIERKVVIKEDSAIQGRSWPLALLEKLIKDYTYFEGRGISAETQRHFRMGVALTGTFAGRVVVPVFDERKTKIIGFTGRLINYTKWHKENKIGKWKHGGSINQGFVCGDEGIIKDSGIIIIVEGPGDVLALYEYGIKNAMCIFGTRISSKQLAFILKVNPKKILVSLNNEPDNKNIGNHAANKLVTTLKSYFNEDKIHLALPLKKDFLEKLETDKNLLDKWREKWLTTHHGDCPTS